MAYPAESIPDPDRVFCRVHKDKLKGSPSGAIPPGCFRGDEMSVDWERYAAPADTRSRAPNSPENGVVSLVAGQVRATSLVVKHTPIFPENRAHADVIGNKRAGDPQVRVLLARLAKWEISI